MSARKTNYCRLLRSRFEGCKTAPAAGILLSLALLGMAANVAVGQNTPRIGYVYPAGGGRGTSFTVTVGGQYLAAADHAVISGDDVQLEVLGHTRPLTQKEFNDLREKLRELQQRKASSMRTRLRSFARQRPAGGTNTVWTAADEKMLNEIRYKLVELAPNRQANPAIAEKVTLRITIPEAAQPGERELRLAGPTGLSNPLKFQVGALAEFTEPARRVTPENLPAQFRRAAEAAAVKPRPDMNVSLPVVVNGQIMPGEVDRYRFHARQGTKLVIAASARSLIPYLADAVPGWFQATLALYDAKGNELAYDDDFRFNPDPVLYYEIPRDGDYVVEIKDSIYRGREDFVYRISLGEQPFITGIFPLGGCVGTKTRVQLQGWNLPETELTLDPKQTGLLAVSVGEGNRRSNQMLFAVDDLPEWVEQEPNNAVNGAQEVGVPVIINGRINPPGDLDVFRFKGRAGDSIVVAVSARGLNSPLDSVVRLTDAAGRVVAINDDCEDKGAGLTTHHADSRLQVVLPADGTYFVHLADTQRQGGPDYAYRLRLSAPRPDFELRLVPSSLSVRGGGAVPLTVYALRKEGFTNDIFLRLQDAPRGFAIAGSCLPAGQEKVQVTLSAPPRPTDEPVSLRLEGTARVGGREIVRPAVPAEDMMQAFFYRHLVPSQELLVTVSGRWMNRGGARIVGGTPVRIPAGGTAQVQVNGVNAGMGAVRLQLELNDPPDGLAIEKVSPSTGGADIVLSADAAKLKPGLRGNLVFQAYASRGGDAGKGKQTNQRRALVGTLPAVPFEIVGK